MHTFRDSKDTAWEIVIDTAAVKRVRGALKVDLYGLMDDSCGGLAGLLGDPCQLVDVLYVLCRQQADGQQLGDEDFGRRFAGDSLAAAADAFVEELIDFFPQAPTRQSLRSLVAKGRAMGAMLLARAQAQIDRLDPASLLPTSTGSSGNAPASSASTPAPGPSASS